jgi:hypothetical protein
MNRGGFNHGFAAAVIGAIALSANANGTSACPFCTAVAPSLSQLREQADIVLLAEVLAAGKPVKFRIHRAMKGAGLLADKSSLTAAVDADLSRGALALLFGTAGKDSMRWHAVPANETVAGYFFNAPSLRNPELERLPYFADYLEHPEPLIAIDAYSEFGRAPFDLVEQLPGVVPPARLRAWMQSDAVPPARKGLYGLLLGLAKGDRARRENAVLLRGIIVADASDFRAGFDGAIGGYLLLEGEPGLELIESRLLGDPEAPMGDVRHAMTALRFYREYGQRIPTDRLAKALAKTLARPEFAEAAITDLARWQAWQYCDEIAALYRQPEFGSREIRRAIVGFLRACPRECCTAALAELRANDPTGVADAEQTLEKLGRLPQ